MSTAFFLSIIGLTTKTTDDKPTNNLQEQIYIKCTLLQSCFTYHLCCFVVITKDERTLVIKQMSNKQYTVYNHDTKAYEQLPGYQFNDFITASATNILLCYKTYDTVELDYQLLPSKLDMENWPAKANLNLDTLVANFNRLMSSFREPLKIGRYQLRSSDINQLIDINSELNDEQLNAHLMVTTTLLNGILLFDSLLFHRYCRRGFREASEFVGSNWFEHNVILVPVHHSHHWFLFIIDIEK